MCLGQDILFFCEHKQCATVNAMGKREEKREKDQKTYEGVISISRRGVGYLAAEGLEEDIEISKDNLGTALHGDVVSVSLAGVRRGRTQGKVHKVCERARESFIGIFKEEKGAVVFSPDDERFYPNLKLQKNPDVQKAIGSKVRVKIARWASPLVDPVGELLEIIGKAGEHETEMRSIVLSRDMAIDFPKKVEEEAAALHAIGVTDSVKRRDFTAIPTCTIDPDNAKDFDDALSIDIKENGDVEVGIHIADVTHYVRPGSELDREARHRATSIYLVDRTIPMLPETLSNDLCSLKPNERRLTFSVACTFNKKHEFVGVWMGKTIIRSQKRFTYQGAQEVLDAGTGPLAKELKILHDIGLSLRTAREKEGAISFDTSEVRFELDEKGVPISVKKKERLETMRMVEDWMLFANQEVARFVANHVKNKKPIEQTFIYRVHDTPDSDKIEGLRLFLRALGYELEHDGTIDQARVNKILSSVKGTLEETVVTMSTLRSMAKAVYSHKNIGHFSLSFSHYTHFTSPIRRYADVMVHRILASHLDDSPLSEEELRAYQNAAIHATEREIEATEAERDSIRYKQVEYMQKHIGKVFSGTITGVTENGFFVAENETLAEGMVHVTTLDDDYYEFLPKTYTLRGTKLKKTFRLGDSVNVKLTSADLRARRIDWAVA